MSIGLVAIGLLAGVLAMLAVVDLRNPAVVMPKVVERVQLGASEPLQPVSVPDSAVQGAVLDVGAMNQHFRSVAQRVTPAVVYLQVEVSGIGDASRDWYHQFEGEGERFFRPRQSVGSGVLISPQGYVVTNQHVVKGAGDIQVTLANKRQYSATVVGTDASTDLAVIKVDADVELPAVALGNSDDVEVGEWVLAVGNPFRLTSTVTAGIVSALGRQVNIIDDAFRIEDFIQTDAAINPGNSGGALVNMKGELVGISTAIATESGSYEGYGFAVPVNLVERVVHDLIAYGQVQRGFMGVKIRDVNARLARQLGLDEVSGVYVTEATPGGAAHEAGLRRGDVVTAVDGRDVTASNELQSAIARHRPGEDVDVDVWRGGEHHRFRVTLLGRDSPVYQDWLADAEEEPPAVVPETFPGGESDVVHLDTWGVGVRELRSRDLEAFDVDTGVYVAYVERGSAVDRAGLVRGVVLLDVAGRPVTSVEDLVDRFEEVTASSEPVVLRVKRRDGLTAFYEMDAPPEG